MPHNFAPLPKRIAVAIRRFPADAAHLCFGLGFVLKYRFLGRHTPLIAGLAITNKCNLKCRHCRVPRRAAEDMTYNETTAILDSFYREGGRTLYLEGGEPFLWRDGQRRFEDIIAYAHAIGYYTVVVYTNGTMPLTTSADTVFVSVDGLKGTHDSLRGSSYDRIMNNIRESTHASLYLNFTINNHNKNEIEAFCEHVQTLDNIHGVFFYFHTPYYGYDDLYIEPDERKQILLRLIAAGKKYKILNSRAGLRSALANDWKRPMDICRVYEKGAQYECCRFDKTTALCQNCGYLSYAEIHQTLKLSPSAIIKAFKYF
jgi:Fe-coproporphyrin III synthase